MSVRSVLGARRIRPSVLVTAGVAVGLAVATAAAPTASATPADQTVTFSTSPPSPSRYGGTYTPAASASSGLPVTISVDAGTPNCTINGSGVVTFVHVGTCTLNANQGGNSSYNPASAQQSFTIDPAPLSVTMHGSQTYGGSSTAYFTSDDEVSGLQLGDKASVVTGTPTCTSSVTPTSGVGSYPITGCSGLSATNYTISYVLSTVVVHPAQLLINASSATFVYGQSVPTITASYSGFVNGETSSVLTTPPTCGTTATSTSSAGTYSSSCAGAVAANYAMNYGGGVVTVTRASLVITASNGSFTYGDSPSAVTPSYSGFRNGDTASSLTTAPTCTTDATSSSPAGTYTTSCSGAVAANYTIAYQNGVETVNTRQVIVTASSPSVQFGAAIPPITASYSGFVNGDTQFNLAAQAACSTTATSTSAVGSYPTTCSGASGSNYTFSYVPGTLSIVPAVLTISASSATIAYGTNPPAITPFYDGFLNGDSPSTLTTQPTCGTSVTHSTPVGTYTTMCSGASSPNYTIQYVAGQLTVQKAVLSVMASDESRPMGGANVFAYTISGFANGESSSVVSGQPTFTTSADTSSEPGMYAIYPAQGTLASNNYSFAFSIGWLTVTKGTAKLTAATATRSSLRSTGKMTFSATATNNLSGLPIPNVTLTFTVTFPNKATLTCTGTTNSAGTASCKSGDGRLLLSPPNSYTVSFPGNYDYLPATGTGKIA